MAVDLHTHSSISDGTDAPGDLVAKAAAAGLTAIALTDHDTLAGIDEARRAAGEHDITMIPGTELSVEWPTGTMHLLVYFVEPGSGPLQDRLAELRDGRTVRNRKIVTRLNELGLDFTLDDVAAVAAGESVGRPHIADVMVERGYVRSRREAFDRYLATGRPAYFDRLRLHAETAIRLAAETGALTSIAHPYTIGIGRDDYREAFTTLAATGLTGIEAFHSEHDPDLRTHLANLAEDLGLVATGGSDYHGTGKEGVALGVGRGDLDVADEVLVQLNASRR